MNFYIFASNLKFTVMKSPFVFLVLHRENIVAAFTSLGLANSFIAKCVCDYKLHTYDFQVKFIELNSKIAHFYFYE